MCRKNSNIDVTLKHSYIHGKDTYPSPSQDVCVSYGLIMTNVYIVFNNHIVCIGD